MQLRVLKTYEDDAENVLNGEGWHETILGDVEEYTPSRQSSNEGRVAKNVGRRID
jgi:hypothetical protein